MATFWICIAFITPLISVGFAYFAFRFLKGKKLLIALVWAFPSLITYASILLFFYVFPSPPPYTINTFLGSFWIATMLAMIVFVLLYKTATYVWINNEEIFKQKTIPKDGRGILLVYTNPVKLISRAVYVSLWYYGFWIGVTGLLIAAIFNHPLSFWLSSLSKVGILTIFDLTIVRLFPRCLHCGFGILALNEKRQCFKESPRLLFKGECTCVNCGAHYFLSAEKLQRYQASQPTPVSPDSQNIQP